MNIFSKLKKTILLNDGKKVIWVFNNQNKMLNMWFKISGYHKISRISSLIKTTTRVFKNVENKYVHLGMSVCDFICISLSACVCFCLCLYGWLYWVSVYLCFSVNVSNVCGYLCLWLWLCVCVSVCESVCLSVCVSVCLSAKGKK